jgi:hypothetical protein
MRNLNHVSIEQTDITIADSADHGEPSKWRSVAIEGAQENITKFLETKVCGGGGNDSGGRSLGEWLREVGGEPRGYAQFIMDLSHVTQPGRQL